MKVQLVHPPVYTHPSAFTAMRPAPPVGLADVGASLRESGHSVSLLDAVGEAPTRAIPEAGLLRVGLDLDAILARLDPEAQAVAITNMWSHSWPLPTGTRCEVVDAEVAPLLARSGCRSLAYAPESGSERTRKLIKKRMKTESLSARQLNFYKYWIFLNFYGMSLLSQPRRLWRLLYNLVMDLEDSKMDVLLHDRKVRVMRFLGLAKQREARPS